MIRGLTDSGAMPTLERLVQFTGERQRILAHNAANISTPNFRPKDLDIESFQSRLAEAHEARRRQANPTRGPLALRDSQQVSFDRDSLATRPDFTNQNILFHDRNNRDLERSMQALAENALTHSAGIEMYKNQLDMLRTAIRERI